MVAAGGGSAETKAIEHVAERLRTRLELPPEVIDAEIALALAEYAGRPIRDFVPILVEREVLDHLNHVKV